MKIDILGKIWELFSVVDVINSDIYSTLVAHLKVIEMNLTPPCLVYYC
jgi:hypothetical protein